MKKLIVLILISLISLQAQQLVKFNAQIRPRLEFDNKDFNSSNSATSFTLLRTRLGAQFNPNADITGYVQIQDSRSFGSETSTTANMKNVDLYQAYFKINNFLNLPIDFKVGRFELSYNNERLIGVSGWGNTGRSFDGSTITYNSEKVKAEFFAIQEFEKNAVGDTSDQNMFGLLLDLKLLPNYQIQPILIWQKFVPTSQLSRFTTGTYIKGTLGSLTHEEEFYYQFGKMKSSKEYDINSFFAGINLTYNFNLPAKPYLSFGLDYSSGDDDFSDNNYKVFNTVYGTGHKFFGYMDYFTNLPLDTYSLGLSDFYLRGGLNLLTDVKASTTLHIFNSAQEYKLKTGSNTKSFGNELDLNLTYSYDKNISFESGLSFFSPGDIFKEKKGKDSSTWFYLMIIANF